MTDLHFEEKPERRLIGFRAEEDLKDFLEKECKRLGKSQNDLIVAILRDYKYKVETKTEKGKRKK